MMNATKATALSALCAVIVAGPGALPSAKAAAETTQDVEASEARQWKKRLGLGAEQTTKYIASVKARQAGLQPLHEQLRAAMRKLQSQLSEKAAESSVETTLREIKTLNSELLAKADSLDARIDSLLTANQRARLVVWKSMGMTPLKYTAETEPGEGKEWTPGEDQEPE
jgi:chromosome segregation ATPase